MVGLGLQPLLIGLGWRELLVVLAIVVVVFGASRIAGLGKASGRAIREFRDELKTDDPSQDKESDAPVAAKEPGN